MANSRFPFSVATQGLPAETSQIITLTTGTTTFPQSGNGAFVDTSAWKLNVAGTETPYCDIVLEFRYSGSPSDPPNFKIGDGTYTNVLGLYTRRGTGAAAQMFLLGTLGFRQGTVAPTIPIAGVTGYAQMVCNVAVYDALAIGGLNGPVLTGDAGRTVTVTARPIRRYGA